MSAHLTLYCPPSSATNAIADRSDLNEKGGDYVIGDVGFGDSAAIDAKITLASWIRAADFARGELPFEGISGPTVTDSCPMFVWSTSPLEKKVDHVGQVDAWDFAWVKATW